MVKAPRTPKADVFHGVSLVGLQTPSSSTNSASRSTNSSKRSSSASTERSSSSPSKYDLEISAHKLRDLGKYTTTSVSKRGRERKLALASYEGTHDGAQPKEAILPSGGYSTGKAAKKALKRVRVM